MATNRDNATAEHRRSSTPKWGDNVLAHRRDPDTMEEARARACLWTVSSSAGLLCLCTTEAVARAVAAALGSEREPEPVACLNVDRRQLSLLGGKVA